jgi:hypothetical protein
MDNDFDDLYDIDNMDDDEIRDLIRQEIEDTANLDPDLIEVEVEDGHVTISGRVGTEQEIQLIDQLLTDTLGLSEVSNELVLDQLVRGQRSEAADEAWVEENAGGSQLGHKGIRTSDEASHLQADVDADQFGTGDPQEAVERGTTYDPPTGPTRG